MQLPAPGGWIKLWRSMKDNGHLQMPDKAFKLLCYILLQVNYKPGSGCQPGEGWITYQMIRDGCCDPEHPPWNDTTISQSLRYLEEREYIQRIKLKRGAAQRIRVVNWEKYQDESTTDTVEVPVVVPVEVGREVAVDKQEGMRKRRSDDEDDRAPPVFATPPEMAMREKADTLIRWINEYCDKSLRAPLIGSRWERYIFDGFEVDTVQLAVEEATLQGRGDSPAYVYSILNRWKVAGAFTKDKALELQQDYKKARERERQRSPEQRPKVATPIPAQSAPSVYDRLKPS